MDNLKQIRAIAARVRKWAEKNYAHSRYYTKDLCGLCAICSYRIFCELKKHGIESEFVLSDCIDHCFVLVVEFIVDVTATQFAYAKKRPKVLIRHVKKVDDEEIWGIGKKTSDPSKIKDLLRHWPKEQQPAI